MCRAPLALLAAALALAGCERGASSGRQASAAGSEHAAALAADAEGQRLREVTERWHDRYLELHPLTATAQGDDRWNDRFGDYASEAWMADGLAMEQEALQGLASVDPAKLGAEDLLTYESFRHGRRIAVEGYRYPAELLPVHQASGLHAQFALLGSGRGIQSFVTARDYDAFLGRMEGFVAWVDQAIANMRSGADKGFVQPRVVIQRVIAQLDALAVDDPTQSTFWRPIENFPAGLSVADRERLTKAYAATLSAQVLPAYRRLRDFLKSEYLPRARETVAWSELPNGAEWYAYLVRLHTTTDLTPAEIHELGLAEVERLRGQLDRMARQLGHKGDLRSFLDALRADPRQYYTDPQELLARYEAVRARVDRSMPLLFARLPRTGIQLRPFEESRARWEAGASYQPPSADGRRPGVLYVNTWNLPARPKFMVESLYLHEAVPGRHYQVSLAQEATDLPRYSRFAGDTAFGEGWALYVESLGPDLGLYADPYGAFGALNSETLGAARLVVDTGLHSRGWTREQAIDYLRANTALSEADIVVEVERCIAWPGRTLAGKVGQLRIQQLRRRAEAALGPRFDVRAFHEQVTGSGSLPLAVLEAKIDRWIAAQK
jgi:uncharacterized protein (DUF885 family)